MRLRAHSSRSGLDGVTSPFSGTTDTMSLPCPEIFCQLDMQNYERLAEYYWGHCNSLCFCLKQEGERKFVVA